MTPIGLYEGEWKMLCIGTGSGPKNVLAERVEDGKKLVVTYRTWKYRMQHFEGEKPNVYTVDINGIGRFLVDAQVQIMQVQVRNTRSGRAVYDVSCSDGVTRQVWESGLATAINAYTGTGQPITIRYDVRQNGKYTNQTIQAFAPPGQQLPPDNNMQPAQMGGGSVMQLPVPGAPAPVSGPPIQQAPQGGGNPSGRWTPETTTRITKLACIEYASTLVAGLMAGAGPESVDQAVDLVETIAKRFYAGARAHEVTAPQPQGMIVPTATTPQEVAQQLPPGMVTVGAPVAAQQDASAEAPDVIQWD